MPPARFNSGQVDIWGTDRNILRPRTSLGNGYGLPGAAVIGRSVTTFAAGFNSFTLLEPWAIQKQITITDLRLITNSGSAGATMTYGIYRANSDLDLTELVYQSSSISLTSSGEKVTSGLSILLQPGRYYGAWNMSAQVQVVGWNAINPFAGFVGDSTSNMVTNIETQAGVFPTPPITPTPRNASSGSGLGYYLSARWTI